MLWLSPCPCHAAVLPTLLQAPGTANPRGEHSTEQLEWQELLKTWHGGALCLLPP